MIYGDDFGSAVRDHKPEPSTSINTHNPEVKHYSVLTTGNVTVDLGTYPIRQTLFFTGEGHFVSFIIDLLLASGIQQLNFERPFSDYYVADVSFDDREVTPSTYCTEGFTALPLH